MAKGRMIPVSVFENSQYYSLSHLARELLFGIIVLADDQGRLNGHPARLRGDIFTYDDISFDELRKIRTELVEHEWIKVYDGDNQKELIQILDWWNLQLLQWAQASDYPAPNGWVDRIRVTYNSKYTEINWSKDDYQRALAKAQKKEKSPPDHVHNTQEDVQGEQQKPNAQGNPTKSPGAGNQVDAPGGKPRREAQVDAPGGQPRWEAQVDAPGGQPRWEAQVDAPGGQPRWEAQVDAPGGHPRWEAQVDTPGGQPRWEAQVDAPGGHPRWTPQVGSPGGQPRWEAQVDAPGGQPRWEAQVDAPGGHPKPKPKLKPKHKLKQKTTTTPLRVNTKGGADAEGGVVAAVVVEDLPTSVNEQLALLGWADGYGEIERAYAQEPDRVTAWLEHTLASDIPHQQAAGYFRNRLREGKMPPKKLDQYAIAAAQYDAPEEREGGNGKTRSPTLPDKAKRAWQTALGRIQSELKPADFNTWARDSQLVSAEEGVFTLAVHNEHARSWLDSQVTTTANQVLTKAMGQPTQAVFVVWEDWKKTHRAGGNDPPNREPFPSWWDSALSQLQQQLSRSQYDTWVRDIEPVSAEGDAVTLAVANEYTQNWLEDRLKSTIARLLTGAIGQEVQVNFVVR